MKSKPTSSTNLDNRPTNIDDPEKSPTADH